MTEEKQDRCDCSGSRCNLSIDDERHGTTNGYGNHFCRCSPCRKAGTLSVRERRESLEGVPCPSHLHGRLSGYILYNCRCRKCQAWYRSKYPHTGHGLVIPDSEDGPFASSLTRVRRNQIIKSLFATGVTVEQITDTTGISKIVVREIVRNRNSTTVRPLSTTTVRRKKRKFHPQFAARNLTMFQLHKDGMSLTEIGRRYNLTRERVRQIVAFLYHQEQTQGAQNATNKP